MRDYTRYGGSHLQGGMGIWKEAVCKVCGKTYMRTAEHAYKECCSWSCLSRQHKREDEAQKAREEAEERQIIQKERARVERTIEKCRARVAYYDVIAAQTKDVKAKSYAKEARGKWQRVLLDAEAHLARLQS